MGGIITKKNKMVSDDVFYFRKHSSGTLKRTTLKIFRELNDESSENFLRAICSHTIGIEIFVRFLQSDFSYIKAGIGEYLTSCLQSWNMDTANIREKLTLATIPNAGDFSASDLEFLDIAAALVIYYLDSPFLDEWNEEMADHAITYLSKHDIFTETTFPELLVTTSTDSELCVAEAICREDQLTDAYVDDLSSDALNTQNQTGMNCAAAVECQSISTVESTFKSCDPMEWPKLTKVLRDHSWLYMLMISLETMPISLTVSAYNGRTLHRPLVYVNKHFESLFRTTRDCIVGMSVTFMQTRATAALKGQQAKLANIACSISSGKSCVYPLICSSAVHGIFQNVIAVKPIMGIDAKPTHVITLQKQAKNDDDVKRLTILLQMLIDEIEV